MKSRVPAIPGGAPTLVVRGRAAGYRLRSVAVIVLLVLGLGQGVAGCAVAQVSGPPEYPSVALTSQAPLAAQTRVIRDPDGHAVVTRDAHGTDITVQRTPGHYGDHDSWTRSYGFGDPDTEARFRWPPSLERHQPPPSLGDEYRQRMRERLDRHP